MSSRFGIPPGVVHGSSSVPSRRAALIVSELAEAPDGLSIEQLLDLIPPPRPFSIRQMVHAIMNQLEYEGIVEFLGYDQLHGSSWRLRSRAKSHSMMFDIDIPRLVSQ